MRKYSSFSQIGRIIMGEFVVQEEIAEVLTQTAAFRISFDTPSPFLHISPR
jgi:hypothetical protein